MAKKKESKPKRKIHPAPERSLAPVDPTVDFDLCVKRLVLWEPEMLGELKAIAGSNRRTLAEEIRHAIDRHLATPIEDEGYLAYQLRASGQLGLTRDYMRRLVFLTPSQDMTLQAVSIRHGVDISTEIRHACARHLVAPPTVIVSTPPLSTRSPRGLLPCPRRVHPKYPSIRAADSTG